jgi:hypothetical protein
VGLGLGLTCLGFAEDPGGLVVRTECLRVENPLLNAQGIYVYTLLVFWTRGSTF